MLKTFAYEASLNIFLEEKNKIKSKMKYFFIMKNKEKKVLNLEKKKKSVKERKKKIVGKISWENY